MRHRRLIRAVGISIVIGAALFLIDTLADDATEAAIVRYLGWFIVALLIIGAVGLSALVIRARRRGHKEWWR